MSPGQLAGGLLLYVASLKRIPAGRAALLGLLELVLGPLWVWLFDGEKPDDLTLLGGLVVIGAAAAWLAASGVAPETCPTQARPGVRPRDTSEIAVSGTQRRTTSGSSSPTAMPRSRRRALTAEPTRPEPMTWTLSITISLQLRTGCRAPPIVLPPRAAACCSS